MHFSKTTQYAVRVLGYIYCHSPKPHSAAFLHTTLELPYKYLTKLLTKLEKKGLLSSIKGRNGGFVLARDAQSITFGDILEAVDESLESQQCVLGFEMCDAKNPCALHDRWLKPKKAIDEMIEQTTLEILMHNRDGKI